MNAIDTGLLSELARIVGADNLRRADQLDSLDPGVDQDNLKAGLAVRPASTAEVSGVLALCNRAGVPVVTHGGRTGLAGGAASQPGEIVLMTDRMARIIGIDPLERVAVVQAGVTLQALQEATAEHGLSPGVDLAARGSATVGGMISTNAGGMEAYRNGMMRQRLLGLEAVLADGTVLGDAARVTKSNEGYDLKQLFCGSEGTLGVVTEAILLLERADPAGQTLLIACDDARMALTVMRAIQDSDILLLAEIMWQRYAAAVAQVTGLTHVLAFYDAPVYAIYQTAGDEDAAFAALEPFFESGTILDAVLAKSERERADIWRIREDSFAAGRVFEHSLWYDVSLPVTGLDGYVDGLRQRLAAIDPELDLLAFGHLADGNLHLTVGAATAFDGTKAQAVSIAVEEGIRAAGGSISAEHGIGTEKLGALARNTAPETLMVMRRLKAALDPKGILNPGKVVPPEKA